MAKTIIKILIAAIMLTAAVSAKFNNNGNTRFDSLITAGIDQIYMLHFEEAEETFELVRNDYPEHPAGTFFDAMILWWKILLDLENEDYDDEFYDRMDDVIDMCDDILDEDDENVDALFFKGGSLGFKARLLSIRQDWFDAALDGKEALPLVLRAHELDSTNVDVQLGFGIYNYYAEVVPEKYPAVKPVMMFFPNGDKELGLKQLRHTANNGKYTRYETQYFLMTLYYQFEEQYDSSLAYAERLVNRFPDNPKFQRYYGRIYVKKSRCRQFREVFTDVVKKHDAGMRGYDNWKIAREANYYIGVGYDYENQSEKAEKYFLEAIELSETNDDEESGFNVNAYIYLGKIEDMRGNREQAMRYYERILDLPDFRGSHEKAERWLENPFGS